MSSKALIKLTLGNYVIIIIMSTEL